MNRKVLFLTATFSLLFGTLVFACFQVLTVEALVPSIVSVSFREVGSTVWVDVVISHQPPPAIDSSHYVSNVQLEINGAGTDLTQSPQSTTTFTVEYNLGSNTSSYSVRARALCTLHGYSSWSATTAYTPPTPTPSPSQSPVPTGSPTPSPEPTATPNVVFPQEALYAIVIAAVGIAVVVVIWILRKQKK
jgi:hypothetical protein